MRSLQGQKIAGNGSERGQTANERHDVHFVWYAVFCALQYQKGTHITKAAEKCAEVIPGEKIEVRREAQMRGRYEFTEQFYESN